MNRKDVIEESDRWLCARCRSWWQFMDDAAACFWRHGPAPDPVPPAIKESQPVSPPAAGDALARAVGLLREAEWFQCGHSNTVCPWCDENEYLSSDEMWHREHAPDCPLSAFLATLPRDGGST